MLKEVLTPLTTSMVMVAGLLFSSVALVPVVADEGNQVQCHHQEQWSTCQPTEVTMEETDDISADVLLLQTQLELNGFQDADVPLWNQNDHRGHLDNRTVVGKHALQISQQQTLLAPAHLEKHTVMGKYAPQISDQGKLFAPGHLENRTVVGKYAPQISEQGKLLAAGHLENRTVAGKYAPQISPQGKSLVPDRIGNKTLVAEHAPRILKRHRVKKQRPQHHIRDVTGQLLVIAGFVFLAVAVAMVVCNEMVVRTSRSSVFWFAGSAQQALQQVQQQGAQGQCQQQQQQLQQAQQSQHAEPSLQKFSNKDEKMPAVLTSSQVAILLSISTMCAFATDCFIPSVPLMAKSLQTEGQSADGALQANWLVKGVYMLVLGPVSDRLGRKIPLVGAGILVAMGATACACANSIAWLTAARIIQGVGEAGEVLCGLFVRDIVENTTKKTKLLALLGAVQPFAVILGPLVGGWLGGRFGWRGPFVFVAAWAALNVLMSAVFLPESWTMHARNANRISVRTLLTEVVQSKNDGAILLCNSLLVSTVYSMLSSMPFLLEDVYHLGIGNAALLIATVPVSSLLAATLTSKIKKQMDAGMISRIWMNVQIVPCIGFLLASSMVIAPLWAVMLLWHMMVFTITPSIIAFSSMNTSFQKDTTGMAGTIRGSLAMIVGACMSFTTSAVRVTAGLPGYLSFVPAVVLHIWAVFWVTLGIQNSR